MSVSFKGALEFGVGKTTVAELLLENLKPAFLLDPEVIGTALYHLVPPSIYPGDFQDLELWRIFTREAVLDAAKRFDGFVIVPMTIARPEYFGEVVGEIARTVRLDHFTLMASRETIIERERRRPDDRALGFLRPSIAFSRRSRMHGSRSTSRQRRRQLSAS